MPTPLVRPLPQVNGSGDFGWEVALGIPRK